MTTIEPGNTGAVHPEHAVTQAPLLELADVHAGYGPIAVLKGVSLTVQPGEIVALIGGNGAGKTTSLLTISGIRLLEKAGGKSGDWRA